MPVPCRDVHTFIAMTTSSSSAQAARQRLAGQLRDLRVAAGLSGRAFAEAAGCQPSKVSQIEKAVRPASMADVQLWCSICGASGQRTAELLAEQAAAARLWSAYRDLGRHGLNATQKLLVGDMFERVRLHRAYQTKVVPGLLQTHAYMTGIMTAVRRERDDVKSTTSPKPSPSGSGGSASCWSATASSGSSSRSQCYGSGRSASLSTVPSSPICWT